jgi:3-hydroxybutyryl-CoA dehydrogenase
MKILIIGEQSHFQECRETLGEANQFMHSGNYSVIEKQADNADLIFDFIIGDYPQAITHYDRINLPVFLNTVKTSLSKLFFRNPHPVSAPRFGFNGMPTLFKRELLEVVTYRESDKNLLADLCSSLGKAYQLVDDRVGLVTPRVICMIINEAHYTVQEGTASKTDIDVAMKLGTNYPFGPFEWCQRIGIKNVYETLDALYADTHDERYKICPLLKTEYLREH